jgi:NhaA family Na+:H+ antiporter
LIESVLFKDTFKNGSDGLMAIFFLLIGLEIERELYIGELSDLKNATLPIFAAVGGWPPAFFIYPQSRK